MPALTPGSKVLVTGSNGFIGSWIVQELLDQGFVVRAAVRSEEKAKPLAEHFESAVKSGKLSFVYVSDIVKEGAFDEAADGVDGIVHTASPVIVRTGKNEDYFDPAINGTVNVLKTASAKNVKRVVLTSSVLAATGSFTPEPNSVYDEKTWSPFPDAIRHAPGLQPRVLYTASKTLAERAAWDYYEKNKATASWDLVALNPPYVYGPTLYTAIQPGVSTLMWFGNVIKDTPKDAETLKGSFAYTDVRDTAKAHVLALTKPEAGGERFILNAGNYTWQQGIDLINTFENLPNLGEPRTKGIPGLEASVNPTYNGEKAKKVLGIEYRSFEETVRDTLNDFARRAPKL